MLEQRSRGRYAEIPQQPRSQYSNLAEGPLHIHLARRVRELPGRELTEDHSLRHRQHAIANYLITGLHQR